VNPILLLQHFDRISEAPDAILRLRQLILCLAVRGELVSQDPNDEPASELLRQFQTEEEHLIEEGKIRKQEPLQPVNDADLPFAVPRHWIWLRLCEIGSLSGGMTPSKNRSDYWEGEINWFSPKDIKSDELLESELKITPVGVTETGLNLYPPGCLFMVARSGILKRTFPVAINRIEATVNQDLKVLKPFMKGLERYLQIMFRGMTDFILSTLVKTGTTVQSLKYEEFELQPIPLPPLSEQHRIVAKVGD
jgi:type I restriction enzyme S subunit